MMRALLTPRAALAAVATLLFLAATTVQSSRAASPQQRALEEAVICDALGHSTLVCLFNESGETISKISCSGFWGSTDLQVPRGSIRPDQVEIVDLQLDKCNKHITVSLRSGRQIKIDGFDTTNNTRLIVEPN